MRGQGTIRTILYNCLFAYAFSLSTNFELSILDS